MGNPIIINLPPMPNPADFGLNTDSGWAQNLDNNSRYKMALKAWQQAVTQIADAQKKTNS